MEKRKGCNLKTNTFAQEKYSRQTILKEIGYKGQEKLSQSKVIIIGVGALGTNTAELLTRAGIGSLTLIDVDQIEESNLQRQTLFVEKDVGKNKAEIAKEKLEKTNSLVKIEAKVIELNENNREILKNADLILDCTDNLETRFLINDYCKKNKKPWIYSSCVKTYGYVMPILPEGPCLRCFLKQADLDSACTSGIINTIPASIAALQVTLATKLLLKETVDPILYYYNIWNTEFKRLKIKKTCSFCIKN